MKKIFSTIVILIALLAMTTGAAFAGSALELVEVRNDDGQPKFVFRVTGEFSQEELESGFVILGDEVFPLYCAQTAPDTVVCHTSKAVAGHEVVVGFGGARFWDKVPEQAPPGGGNTQYCYPTYGNNSATSPTDFIYYGERCDPTDDVFEFYANDLYRGNTLFIWLWESDMPWLDSYCIPSYNPQGEGFYSECIPNRPRNDT